MKQHGIMLRLVSLIVAMFSSVAQAKSITVSDIDTCNQLSGFQWSGDASTGSCNVTKGITAEIKRDTTLQFETDVTIEGSLFNYGYIELQKNGSGRLPMFMVSGNGSGFENYGKFITGGIFIVKGPGVIKNNIGSVIELKYEGQDLGGFHNVTMANGIIENYARFVVRRHIAVNGQGSFVNHNNSILVLACEDDRSYCASFNSNFSNKEGATLDVSYVDGKPVDVIFVGDNINNGVINIANYNWVKGLTGNKGTIINSGNLSFENSHKLTNAGVIYNYHQINPYCCGNSKGTKCEDKISLDNTEGTIVNYTSGKICGVSSFNNSEGMFDNLGNYQGAPIDGNPAVAGPVIEKFSPESVTPNDEITILGKNFGADKNAIEVVFAGGVIATPSSIENQNKITVKVPKRAVSGKIIANINGVPGQSSADMLNIESVAPFIDGFTPQVITPGGTITIRGDYFSEDITGNTVTFAGGVSTYPAIASMESLTVKVPENSHTGKFSVQTVAGEAISGEALTIQKIPEIMKIVIPARGDYSQVWNWACASDEIKIWGDNFSNDNTSVIFNPGKDRIIVEPTSIKDGALTAVVPGNLSLSTVPVVVATNGIQSNPKDISVSEEGVAPVPLYRGRSYSPPGGIPEGVNPHWIGNRDDSKLLWLQYNCNLYLACDKKGNGYSIVMVKIDPSSFKVIASKEFVGARYIESITVNSDDKTLILVGQNDKEIKLKWGDLNFTTKWNGSN